MRSNRTKIPAEPGATSAKAEEKRLVVAPATEAEILRIDRAAVEARMSRARFIVLASLEKADRLLGLLPQAA